jgi:hypothetical protein
MENKLLCLMFQLQPTNPQDWRYSKTGKSIFLPISLNADYYHYPLGFRHKPCFDREVYMILKKNNVCMA